MLSDIGSTFCYAIMGTWRLISLFSIKFCFGKNSLSQNYQYCITYSGEFPLNINENRNVYVHFEETSM
jgi:hypothetical protein